jgi:hypothetical protein
MDKAKEAIIVAEYNTLRAELLENRRYIFERPLLIVTALGIASMQISNKSLVIWLSFLFTVVLLVNLWFTKNRLRSIGRISAYIAVVLESCPEKWIGWECSLRKYRTWENSHSPEEIEKLIAKRLDASAVPGQIMFYYPLFMLHIIAVAVALAISIGIIFEEHSLFNLIAFFANVVTVFILAGYCAGSYRPSEIKYLIERQRVMWIDSLGISEGSNTHADKIK